MDTYGIETDIKDVNSSLVRIQRSFSELMQCKDKLTSYLSEPKTPELFETRENLVNKMEVLLNGHLDLLSKLEHKKDNLNKELNRVKSQLLEVRKLEQGISTYMVAAHQ